jgi:hypothetical protein
LYLAGATNLQYLDYTVGHRVLETFAEIRKIATPFRPLWAGAMLDSGAFSAHMSGVKIDLGEYRAFVEEKGSFYESIAALDDIADWRKSVANWRAMEDMGVFPTYHEGEPPELFVEYAEEQLIRGGWVGFGAQRPIVPERLLGCLREHRDNLGDLAEKVHIHGFGLTMYSAAFPFQSTDSTLWTVGLQKLMVFSALNHLTKREMMDILVARLERAPRRLQWDSNWAEMLSKVEERQRASTVVPLESILEMFGEGDDP